MQAHREQQGGPGKHFRGTPKRSCGALLGRNFLNFAFCVELCILVYFIFLSDGGPRDVWGPGVAYPLPHPLDGPA